MPGGVVEAPFPILKVRPDLGPEQPVVLSRSLDNMTVEWPSQHVVWKLLLHSCLGKCCWNHSKWALWFYFCHLRAHQRCCGIRRHSRPYRFDVQGRLLNKKVKTGRRFGCASGTVTGWVLIARVGTRSSPAALSSNAGFPTHSLWSTAVFPSDEWLSINLL